MKKALRKEIFWFAGTLMLAILSFGLTLGFHSLLASEIDIPLHDTYYVSSPLLLLGSWICLLTVLLYFPRQILTGFDSRLASTILLIAAALMTLLITVFTYQVGVLDAGASWQVYPPGEGEATTVAGGMGMFSNLLIIGQVLMVAIIIWTGYRMHR